MTEVLKATTFTADWLTDGDGHPLALQGYSDGSTWNGWACPYFTHEQMEQLQEMLRLSGSEDMSLLMEVPDSFFYVHDPSYHEWESRYVIPSVIADTVDGKQRLYYMGGEWTWETEEY